MLIILNDSIHYLVAINGVVEEKPLHLLRHFHGCQVSPFVDQLEEHGDRTTAVYFSDQKTIKKKKKNKDMNEKTEQSRKKFFFGCLRDNCGTLAFQTSQALRRSYPYPL